MHFAMGGTGWLVRGLVGLIEGQGGAPLQRGGRPDPGRRTGVPRGVRLATGEEIAADIVVSNADSAWTYRHLCRRTPGGAGPTGGSSGRATR